MSPQGSNELNLLLKSKVVKVKVELDIKGSKLAGQVNAITRYLKDKRVKLKVELLHTGLKGQVNTINASLKDVKVKLGVKLSLNKKDINSQIGEVNKLLKGNGIKSIKIDLKIDVKGSASKIKKQLAEINKEIIQFNSKYKKLLEDTQKINNKLNSGSASGNSPKGVINPNTLANSVKDAKAYMTSQFGKGIFSSTELKDAQGQLMGFIAQLTKADGVVQKIKYQWNQDSGTFTPINRTTITNTEKNVSQALKSLRELDREILKLSTNQEKFWQESGKLQQKGASGTLTIDAVNALKARIKEEQVLENKIKEENTLLREQKQLIAQINREQKNTKSTAYKSQLGDIKSSVKNLNLNDVDAKGALKSLENNFKNVSKGYSDATRKEKEYQNVMAGRKKLLQEIAVLEKTKILNYGQGEASKQFVADTKKMVQAIKTTEQYNEALKRMSKTNNKIKLFEIDNSAESKLMKLESVMYKYASVTGKSLSTIETRIAQVKNNVQKNIGLITNEIERYTRLTEKHNAKLNAQQVLTQRQNSVVKGVDNGLIKQFIKDKDNQALKEYIANLNKAQVAMLKLQTDSKGVSRITAQFASTGKTAKQVVYEFNQVDKTLRQISTADVFNANRNLGFFEQLKIAMQRVPIWTIAMTAFYGSLRSVRAITNEVLQLDKAMTELRRVADSQIDVDYMFEGAVRLSKELGNNIHDVMQSVNDLARTFGQFNERQLLAITHTATLMSNVSDLTAQEATESLVGTMNAFNITAEDSIRIVDSMNEVDNNYAISTKQLAEGMSKSASTAKTFGVSLEENIGHITAIGAVTMESGSIIGNSLKTIYSRITTMDDVGEIFEGLGISMRDSEGDMREVSHLLRDLSGVWFDLSDAERQNYAVKIAGRYQLSRFLALMNNYSMAIESTETALSSQGSATRENAKYLESFEARINSLKNSFTEMSASIGEAFLESGLSVGLDMLSGLAGGVTALVDKVGVLSVTFGVLGLALFKFGALSYIWKSTSSSMSSLVIGLMLARDGFVTLGATARTSLSAITSGTMTATQAIRTMGVAIKTAFGFLKSAMLSTGVLAGFVVIGYLIEKLVSHISEVKQKSEELKKTNDTMIKSYRDSGDGMKYMYDRYKELLDMKENHIEMTSEESSELTQLTAQFAEQLPFVVDYYNAQGEAILKSTDAIKEQIEVVANLSQEQAKLQDMQLTENIKDSAKDYDKIAKKINRIKEDIEMMEDHEDKFGIDNTKGIQTAMVELMQYEQERQKFMSNMTKDISEQISFYVEGNGKMVGFGDNQRQLIENFVKYNDSVLMATESEEELEQVSLRIVEVGKQVADVFTDAYDIMSQKLGTEELEEYRQLLENVSTSIPETFLEVDPYSKQEVQQLTDGVKEFINVSHHVKAGSDNFQLLHDRLTEVGYSETEATEALSQLSNQFGNAKLKAEALAQSSSGLADSVADVGSEAIQALSPIEALFGYSPDNVGGLVESLKIYQAMLNEFGEGANSIEGFVEIQERLKGYLQATPEEIQQNIDAYIELGEAMSGLELVDIDGWQFDWDKFMSGLSGDALEIAKAWRDSGGTIEMFKSHLDNATGSAEKYNYEKEKLKEPFDLGEIGTKPLERVGMLAESNFNKHKDLLDVLKGGATDVSTTASAVEVASQKLGSMQGTLGETKVSVDDLGKSQADLAKNSETQFGRVSSTVKTNTDLSVNALKTLDTQLGTTSGNIAGIMRNIGSLSSSIGSLESGIQRVKNLSSSIPNNVTQQSYKGVTTSNDVSSPVANAISSFSATAEGLSSAMSSGGAGEGTSGVIKPSTPSFAELGFYTAYNKAVNKTKSSSSSSSSSRSSSGPKKSSTSSAKNSSSDKKKKAEELAELYVYDLLDRKRTRLQGTLSQLEAKLSSLSKNSLQYRSAMAEVFRYEESILKLNKQELANLEKRNKQIATRLKALGDTSKHTKKQRDEYNKLQQEFDSNLSTISQLKGTIASSMIELKKVSEEMFMDSVGALMISLDRRVDTIVKRIQNIEFEIELLDIVDPENELEKVDLLSTKVRDLYKQQWQYENNMKKMEKELANATSRYGSKSDAVKEIVEKMEEYESAWKDVTLEIKRTEKEIRDIRGKTIDGMIDSIKDYYEEMIKKSNDAYDKEIENAKEAHDEKMKWYDEESKRISDLYDQRIKGLDDDYNQEQYEEELTDRNKEISKLQEKAKTYQGDTSLEGRKKYAELQEEIAEKQKELTDYMKKYELDKLKEKLNEEKDALLQQLEDKKEIDKESHDTTIEELEEKKKAYEEEIKAIIDNEKEWAKVREELVKGNFTVIKQLLTDMGIDVQQLSDGTFDTLSAGFSKYSEEVRTFVTEVSDMITKINNIAKSAYGKTSGLTGSDSVYTGETIRPATVSEIIKKAYAGKDLVSPTPDKQQLYDLVKNSGISEKQMNEIWKKAQSGKALSVPTPEKMAMYYLFTDIIKNRKLSIKSFGTGGYTGDNVPPSGALAILDNKELVLNEKQTSHILDAVELVNKMQSVLPNISRDSVEGKLATASGFTNNSFYELNVNIDKLNGDKDGATLVVKEIMKGLKKLGK